MTFRHRPYSAPTMQPSPTPQSTPQPSDRARLEAALLREPDAPRAGPSASTCCVLIVDADRDMGGYVGRTVASMMKRQPVRVLHALDAPAALQEARALPSLCVVVADADAQHVGGVWLAETMAGDPVLRRTPILLLASDERLASGLNRSTCCVLRKPFTRRSLAAALHTLTPYL